MSCPDIVNGISSIINILEKSIKFFDDTSADGALPEALRTVRYRLPIIVDTFQSLKRELDLVQHSICAKCLKGIVEHCAQTAEKTKKVLEIVHGGNDTWVKRYSKAIRAFSDITTIEALMKSLAECTQSILMKFSVSENHWKRGTELGVIIDEMRSLMAFSFQGCYGARIGQALLLSPDLFIGRELELNEIQGLESHRTCQKVHRVILGGVRGVGKTQLALAYAQKFSAHYESCFWLDAVSEVTLKESFQTLAYAIFQHQDTRSLDKEAMIVRVHEWLSDATNTRWLLIFDGYNALERFDIEKFYPKASHGSIIVTTRKSDLIAGQQVQIQPLQNIKDRLKILDVRSQREGFQLDSLDPHAEPLAEELGGLPLDLATAGAFLRFSGLSVQEYLQQYRKRQICHLDPRRPVKLPDYEDSLP